MTVASLPEQTAALKRAHKFCSLHREQVLVSATCACFYCQETFPPSSIEDWTDDDQTALCPKCGIDSVIGDASGEPIGDAAFLSSMYAHWFGQTVSMSQFAPMERSAAFKRFGQSLASLFRFSGRRARR